jgi:hypothetical protein
MTNIQKDWSFEERYLQRDPAHHKIPVLSRVVQSSVELM